MVSRERSMGFKITNEKEARKVAERLILCGYEVDIYIDLKEDGTGVIRAVKSGQVELCECTFLLCTVNTIPKRGDIIDRFRALIDEYRQFYAAWLKRRFGDEA